MAAIKTLHFIDIDAIDSIVLTKDGWAVNIKPNRYWSRIHFAEATANVQLRQGDKYECRVELTLHGVGSNAERDLLKLHQCHYLVRLTDYNGAKWLLGDEGTPLSFQLEDVRSGSPAEGSHYRCSFAGLTDWPAMRLTE